MSSRMQAILGAILTAVRRDLRSVGSFSGNNLFIVAITLLFFKDPGGFATLTAFIGMVIFIPLSADPLRAVPPVRLGLWPIGTNERRLLRIVTPWLNPVTWLIAALALWKHVTMGLFAVAGGVFAIGFLLPSLPVAHQGTWRWLPTFPGPLNQLVRKDLRQTFSTLDFWGAALVSGISTAFRFAGRLPVEAMLPLSILVVFALSTETQSLFGLDGPAGMTRYRLLPIAGWQILAAKDAAFVLASVVLTAALDPVVGLAASLTALATGHSASVYRRVRQTRWRFCSGVSFGVSIFQVVAIAAAAATVHAWPLLLIAPASVYGWSTRRCGRAMEA